MSTSLSQAFRAQFHPKVITIPTRHDPKSRQRIVRWKDIQQYFKDAQGVMNGVDAVLFLTDDDLEDLIPLRIAHHPGVVLEVVMAIDGQHDPRAIVPSVTHEQSLSSSNSRMSGTQPAYNTSGDTRPTEMNMAALRITDTDNSQALVVHSQSLLSENRVSLHSSSPLYNTIHPVPSSPQGHSTTSTEQFIDGGAERRLLEMGSTMAQQEELRRLRQQMQQMQQQMDGIQPVVQHAEQQAQDLQQQAQESQQQLQQQIDEISHKIQELYQRTQHFQQVDLTHERLQQIDAALQEVRQLNHNVSESQQRLQLQIDEVLQKMQYTQEQASSLIPEEVQGNHVPELRWLASDRRMLMQSRINELMDTLIGELSVPRLFVVLPKSTPTAGDSRDSRPLHFRLHFLCESSTHTKEHKAHFVNHPGYDLTKPNEFFDKYGSYLLTVAYMVKFRSMAGSSLWPSSVTNETGTNQDHLCYIRNNIHGLIDETIRHLERMTGNISSDMEDIAHRMLSTLELSQVEQHLKVEDGECNSGDLFQTAMHDGHYVWVCNEHQRQYHESTMKRLKEVIEANGGKCLNGTRHVKINIKTASEPLTKIFRDGMVQLCNTQARENQRSLKVLGLKLSSVDSTGSITDIFIDRTKLESIELNFSRLSLTIRISEGEIQHSVVEIDRLNKLVQEDLDFIQQCSPVQLAVMDASEKTDEDRLANILQQNPTFTELHVECFGGQPFAIIDIIISSMEKIRQDMGSSSLRTSKVVGKWLDPFGNNNLKSRCNVTVTLSLSMDSDSLNMVTDIMLPDEEIPSGSPMCKFITQYGWSISTLATQGDFSDNHATLLDDGTRARGSKITDLDLSPRQLTATGLGALDRVIKRSLSFTGIRLRIVLPENDTTMALLGRYGVKLYDLHIYECPTKQWLHELKRAFPTRKCFPALRRLDISVSVVPNDPNTPQALVDWIVSMVSTPYQAIINSPSSNDPLAEESQELRSVTPLNTITLSEIRLQPEDWESLIGALDLSSLVKLDLGWSNFSQDQLNFLVDRIDAFGPRPVSLKELCVRATHLILNARMRTLCEKLEARDPKIIIRGPE